MSPISPFVTGGGQGNWQMPDLTLHEYCPVCGSELTSVMGAIGGFPGREHIHPTSVVGYQCPKCNRYFPVGEFLMLKLEKEKKREEAHSDFTKNYLQNIRAVFKSPYLYLIVVGFMLLYDFGVGVIAGVAIVLLMPFLLMGGFEIVFVELGKLVRKILPSNKPPDNPKTP